MQWEKDLRGVYYDIAAYKGQYLRVIAGPGTGKTFSLMRRIFRLLEEGTDSKKILAVTFTRTAAKDLIDKLSNLGCEGAEEVEAKTLHSLAFKMLGQDSVFASTQRIPRPLLKYEIECLISDLQQIYGGKKYVKKLLLEFEAYWATLQEISPGWAKNKERQTFQTDLKKWLVEHDCMLIGELIPLCIDYIRNNPQAEFAYRFDHVIVDEYQDLNRADQEFIEALSREGSVTIAGDENQSIYRFRYANPSGIRIFSDKFKETKDEVLVDCKRCPSTIVNMANALINHNNVKSDSELKIFNKENEGSIYIVQHEHIDDELNNIVDFIFDYKNKNKDISLGEILVLTPRRHIGYEIRDRLKKKGITAQSFFSEESLDTETAQKGFCLLTLLVKSDDKASIRSWLGFSSSSKRTKPYLRLKQFANKSENTVKEYLELILDNKKEIPPYCKDLVIDYSNLKKKLGDYDGELGEDLVNYLWEDTDGNEYIRSIALPLVNVDTEPSDLLEDMIEAITQPDLPGNKDDIVRIMSLHKSKGLTARCVIVTPCVSGAIPFIKEGISSKEAKQILEEQRRLFYVALTRATETLVLSNFIRIASTTALQLGIRFYKKTKNTAFMQSSQFLSELGAHGIKPITGAEWKKQVGF